MYTLTDSGANLGDLTKVSAARWQALPQEEKEEYNRGNLFMYYTYYKHKANFIATSKIGMYVHVCATIWTKYQLSITVLIQVYVFTI